MNTSQHCTALHTSTSVTVKMDINQIKMSNLIGKDQDIDASSMVSADDNSEVFTFY